ncbi:MAG TPA: hypothetical protein PK915_11600, partial [Bacteroidales bacterium]|nr:hypothetical protein [Bacteroidales bacterium]
MHLLKTFFSLSVFKQDHCLLHLLLRYFLFYRNQFFTVAKNNAVQRNDREEKRREEKRREEKRREE